MTARPDFDRSYRYGCAIKRGLPDAAAAADAGIIELGGVVAPSHEAATILPATCAPACAADSAASSSAGARFFQPMEQ